MSLVAGSVGGRVLRDGDEVTWEQYAALPDDGRTEYIGGRLVVSPLPRRVHQLVCGRLERLIGPALPPGHDVVSGWGWKPNRDEYGPDVMVHPVTDEDLRFTGTPLLCVEVLSSNRGRDLVLKPARYARAGLPHYWVVDVRDRQLATFDLGPEGMYVETARLVLPGDDDAGGPGAALAGRGELVAGPLVVDVDLAELLRG